MRRVARKAAALGSRKPGDGRVPAPRRPPGAAKASMFFDAYPRFYETSSTSPFRGRLNLRYEAIFAENRDIFRGARVLDLASHDGRWSLAALKTGASQVVGLEANADLVTAARENLRHYCGDEGQYRFVAGDLFEVLRDQRFEADVVLCLGFLYHTLRYNELLRRIRDIGPRYLVVDTQVMPGEKRRHVRLETERLGREANAAEDPFSYGGQAVVGRPSLAAVRFLLDAYDFEIERFSDWASIIRDNASVESGGYANGRRVTLRCVSKAAAG
jgi:Methyltransferase domain